MASFAPHASKRSIASFHKILNRKRHWLWRFSSLSFVTFSEPIFEALKVLKLKVWTIQWYTNYIFRKWKMCATVLDEQETLPDRRFCCVVLWQAVNCKGQHSISYTLSRNQTVVVEYSHDKDTDMFQVLFCKTKNTLKYLLHCSVSACWLGVGKSVSPTLICLTSTKANQDQYMGLGYISSPRHMLRYRVAHVWVFFGVWSAHEGSSHIDWR